MSLAEFLQQMKIEILHRIEKKKIIIDISMLKKLFSKLLMTGISAVALFLLTLVVIIPVYAQDSGQEQINSFQSSIVINNDGTIDVVETIEYDFSSNERRGILRNIPFIKENKDRKKYKLDVKVNSVQDENGKKYEYKTTSEDENIEIRAGNVNKFLTGVHTYVISYTVKGALTYFSDHDELYWNATGNEWNVPIAKSSATVTMPDGTIQENIKGMCYTGTSGSTAAYCTVEQQNNTVIFSSTTPLYAYEGLTIVTSFPKNIVAVLEPQEVVPFFNTWQGKLTQLGIFGFALFWYILYPLWLPIKWYLYGRDPAGISGQDMGEVRAWFDPPTTKSGRPLTPAEVGVLVDERAQERDISAMIVGLAQKGFLTIVEKNEKEFHLKKNTKANEAELLDYERNFLHSVFKSQEEVNLKTAKLYETVEKAKKDLYTALENEGFFPHNPQNIRTFYEVLSGFAIFSLNFPLVFSAQIFGRNIPVKTLHGVNAAKVGQSLKSFLSSQERQLEFQAKNQMMFEKLLPFAVAFGVERIWSERFKDIALRAPDWYQGYHSGNFNSVNFTRSLGSSFSQVSKAATPTTSSSGYSSGFSGGSSGGGGGGGGGGSW